MSFKILEKYNFIKINNFFKNYEDSLQKSYLYYYIKYGPGVLNANINEIKKKGYCISYIPIANRDKFWDQSSDIINIKKIVKFNKNSKYYLWLIDNNISIFYERECEIKKLMLKKFKSYKSNKALVKEFDKIYSEKSERDISEKDTSEKDTSGKKNDTSEDEEEIIYQMFINY